MIDWLTFTAPLEHDQSDRGPFYAGEILSTQPDPTSPDGFGLQWAVQKRKSIEGSYSKTITVQSTQFRSIDGSHVSPGICISGNPAKWFQGHNIFGSDDLPGLVREMLDRVCRSVGLVPSASDRALWDAGYIQLGRADVTRSWDFGSLPRVRNGLRSLDATATYKHRGRGHFKGDSLTFGKGSRRYSVTLYAKGAEIKVRGHELPMDLAASSLPAFADGLLRAEVRLLSMQLKKLSLDYVCLWGENTSKELHQRFMAGIDVADNTMLDSSVLDGLSGRLQLAYQAWKDGHDMRLMLSRPTFYRYRMELLKHGVDIAVKQERPGPDMSNVVPLRVVLNASSVDVPDWAVGTPYYFEPRFKVA